LQRFRIRRVFQQDAANLIVRSFNIPFSEQVLRLSQPCLMPAIPLDILQGIPRTLIFRVDGQKTAPGRLGHFRLALSNGDGSLLADLFNRLLPRQMQIPPRRHI